MSKSNEDYIIHVLDRLQHMDYIKPKDIPNIDLYMDQVTRFMEEHLHSTKRYPEDKIMTKTMINNYTKNDLLPPPEKKKYSKEHILLLVFIYYLKNFLSMGDIQRILEPLTKYFFPGSGETSLAEIYDKIFAMSEDSMDYLCKGVIRDLNHAKETFSDVSNPEEREYLMNFSFICMLGFDIYIKKMMIEHILDESDGFPFSDPL